MGLNFALKTIEPPELEQACSDAVSNWKLWKRDFENYCDFGSLPLIISYPRFRGFGAEYSVFRNLNSGEIQKLQAALASMTEEPTFESLHSEICGLFPQKRTKNWISLTSKLLGKWRPEKFAMWDQYARIGLAITHNRTRAHCYTKTSASSYCLFNADFFDLKRSLGSKFDSKISRVMEDSSIPAYFLARFGSRVLDNFLMKAGGRY